MARRHSFPGVYADSLGGRFLVGGVQEPIPVAPVIPPVITFTIAGTVTEDGLPKPGVPVAFSSNSVYTTNANGLYSATVARNYTGASTPIFSGGTFTPSSRIYATVISNYADQNFVYNGTGGAGPTPTPTPTQVRLSGYTYDGYTDAPLASVSLNANGTTSTLSAPDGYWFMDVPYGFTGTVSAVQLYGTFNPASYPFSGRTTDSNTNDFRFYADPVLPGPFLVSGVLYDYSDNLGYYVFFAGWEIEWNQGVVVCDGDGYYQFEVPGGFTGTVAFTDTWGTSTPASYPLTHVQVDQPNKNFDIYGPTYAVGGTIWDNYTETPWGPGNTVKIQNYGPADINLTTDAGGRYSINVPWNAEFDIAPLITGDGSLSPASSFHVQEFLWDADDYSYNFQYWYTPPPPPSPYLVSGTFFNLSLDTPVSGATMTFDGIGTTATTNYLGAYSQLVPPNSTFDLYPSVVQNFSPSLYSIVNIAAAAPNQNFNMFEATDCPVPSGTITPQSTSPNITAISRNAMDTRQNLLWTIDESGPEIAYLDVAYGTIDGFVDISPYGQSGVSGIVYDPVSNLVAVTGYFDNSVTLINPVSKTLVGTLAGPSNTGFHMLALAEDGTLWAASARSTAPTPGALICGYDLKVPALIVEHDQVISTDSICWANNIQSLIINNNGALQPSFYAFDPATSAYTVAGVANPLGFCYENYYIKSKGHLLLGHGSALPVRIVTIANGANASTGVALLGAAPDRASDVTVDTCSDLLFVSDGNGGIYENRLSDYARTNEYLGLSPTGLAYSRTKNLLYHGDFNTQEIKSIEHL
ncbi:MAG: hypothetical protein ACOYB3_01280 [Azonexus sp.]